MSLQQIGVIGAGQMGAGIAQVAAQAEIAVVMHDIAPEMCKRGVDTIARNLDRMIERGRFKPEDRDRVMRRVETTTNLEDLGKVGFVIEAVVENEDAKIALLQKLDKVCPPETIFASNTSSISITKMGAKTSRADRVIGMHFMNPVPAMSLVELIRGIATDEETFAATRELALKLGKTPVAAEDFPAFIVNRILLPMINEAVYTLYEGVGSVEAIDTAMKLGANHPMGPLELADFIGLDTCLSVMQVLYEGLADSKYRPCPLLVKYVEAGWLGRKASRGFYDYQGEKPIPTR